jgi:hypothetical protein
MKIDFKEISELDFEQLDSLILFGDKSNRSFGSILIQGQGLYKIGWNSTLIKPNILVINEVVCIGIDLIFIIFDFDKKNILLQLNLDYFFYDVKIHNEYLYVITELEIIKLNISKFEICQKYDLPDYFSYIEFQEDNILISCINGEIVNIGAAPRF